MNVRFTPSGRRLFLDVVNHIRSENPDAALSFRKRAETSLRRLGRFPDSGRAIPEFPSLPHREVIVPPYRFFYRREGDAIWIMAVWHGAQLPDPPPKKVLRGKTAGKKLARKRSS